MEKTSKLYGAYVQILKEELIPAMGCTEPIAIAYAAAKAREVLGCAPDMVKIGVSNNIIKNVKSVIVPNTGGMKGIEAAAAAGIVAGDANKALEVISAVTDGQKQEMRDFLETVPVTVEAIDNGIIFDILVALYHGTESTVVRITHYHTNIVYIKKNSEILLDNIAEEAACGGENPAESGLTDRSLLTIADIFDFAGTCDVEDIRPVLDTQIQYNTAISEEGLRGDYGANIGSTMLKFYGDDVRNRAIAKAAAGSDARMSGCELPVVINSGSGNQGITVSVPVIEYAKALNASEETLYRALALSNLIAIHEKSGIGRLSAYCGAVSAGCAAGCGIAYLRGDDCKAISHTLVNALAIVSGIICDGAKPSCAAKIASSVEAGILGYHMYLNGQQFRSGDGTVKTSGCSVTGYDYTVDELADYFGGRAVNNMERLELGSQTLGLSFYKSENWDYTWAALQEGKIVVALMDGIEHECLFTDSQHFIVLTGLTEDGKRVLVNDPNKGNYQIWNLKDGFADGFTPSELLMGYSGAWVYDRTLETLPERYSEVRTSEYYVAGNSENGVAVSKNYPEIRLTDAERELLARVIWVEAQGECAEGQQAIAEVVFNRMLSNQFGDTLNDVIYSEGQFRSVPYLEDAKPTQAQYQAIDRALYGDAILPRNVYYFATFATNSNIYQQIGNHIFCF